MFILEESQLLEDNIKDPTILNLYKTLRQHESCNDRISLINEILASEKCTSLSKLLFEFYQFNGSSMLEAGSDDIRFTVDQRNEIYHKLDSDQNDVASLALVISAALIQLFVIDNFTGSTNKDTLEYSYKNLPVIFQNLQHQVDFRSLSRDGSEVYHQTVNPWLLRIVQLYWNLLNSLGCSRRLLELEFLIWRHRYLTIYLAILFEPAESVINELRKIQEHIFDHHIINNANDNNTQLVRFDIVELCCELVQSSLLRDGITSCRKFFEYACEISGVSIEHTGVLGKRTKFQQKDLPQLVIKVIGNKDNSVQSEADSATEDRPDLPKDVKLEDDTLLPDISFVTKDEMGNSIDAEPSPNVVAQLLMLTKLDVFLKSEVMEESLKDEWTLAYVRSITRSASIWVVKYKALALRSMIEKKNMRKMDRALCQMEELIKTCESNNDTSHKRLKSFYSVLPLSSWQLQRSLGNISYDLALFKNALDIYLKIEYWEGIIKCYSTLGQTIKAEKVIRQELDKQETPYLYCLLGDATDNIEHYEKSWSLSNGRYARAKKSIGTYFYVRKQYNEAIDNYELALSVNPSSISILSLLAYSCLTTERYDRAAECYRNITYYDDANFLAWNNLSKAYIKLNQKERAWRTLQEAIRCNFNEWKIWENFMIVSIEIGALDDVITAWHRLIDIKSSHRDDQVLSVLTHTLIRRSSSKADSEYVKLLNDALKLVARLNATSDCTPKLWIYYYKLLIKEFELSKLKSEHSGDRKLSKLDIDSRISKITNALQRATPNTLLVDIDWFKIPEKIDRVLDSYDELIDCYLFAIEVVGPRPEILRQWKYFKLSLSNVMKILYNNGYKLDTR